MYQKYLTSKNTFYSWIFNNILARPFREYNMYKKY